MFIYIRNLKANYRRKIVQHIVTQIDSGTDMTASTLAKTVTILDCMHMLKTAWEEVKTTSITNCFRKAGFSMCYVPEQTPDIQSPDGLSAKQFQEFINVDDALECHGELTDADIVASIKQKDEPDSDQEDDHPAPSPVKVSQAYQALKSVRLFLEQNGKDLAPYYAIEKILQETASQTLKQQNITDFFKMFDM